MFDIMVIFYWCLFKPQIMESWFLFLMGLLQDSLLGLPLGFHSLLYIVFGCYIIPLLASYITGSFLIIWSGFALFSSIIIICNWIIFSLFYSSLFNINTSLLQLSVTIALYPMIHYIFHFVHSLLPGGLINVK